MLRPQLDISRRSFCANWLASKARQSFSLGDYHTAGLIFKWLAARRDITTAEFTHNCHVIKYILIN